MAQHSEQPWAAGRELAENCTSNRRDFYFLVTYNSELEVLICPEA